MRYTSSLVGERFKSLLTANSDVLVTDLCEMRQWNPDGVIHYEFILYFRTGKYFIINCCGSREACAALRNIRETLDCLR